jgi:chemotaxis methyl-accepting protein methylase
MLDDNDFRLLLDHLDRPWSGYRKVRKGVKKRVRRHMTQLSCTSIQDYLHRIDRHPAVWRQCQDQLTVTISRFFRDRQLWDQLQKRILPDLTRRFPEGLAVWSAGCANGEEAYSLSIVSAAAAFDTDSDTEPIQILATDADATCLQRAREGRFPESSLKELPEAIKNRWLKPVGGRTWLIDERLSTRIHWETHQLLDKPPRDHFHLILLRNNLLTYYQGEQMHSAFNGIVECLEEGGILIIGSHEHPPPTHRLMKRDPLCPWIYVAH